MPVDTREALWILGRILLGGLFVVAGIRHFFAIAPITQVIVARGMPAAKLVLISGSLFQIVVGLVFASGRYMPWAAAGLIAFTLAASILMLNFWDMQGEAREGAFKNWLSNLALIGGMLIAAAHSL